MSIEAGSTVTLGGGSYTGGVSGRGISNAGTLNITGSVSANAGIGSNGASGVSSSGLVTVKNGGTLTANDVGNYASSGADLEPVANYDISNTGTFTVESGRNVIAKHNADATTKYNNWGIRNSGTFTINPGGSVTVELGNSRSTETIMNERDTSSGKVVGTFAVNGRLNLPAASNIPDTLSGSGVAKPGSTSFYHIKTVTNNADFGTLTASPAWPTAGSSVTVTATPADGYMLTAQTVKNASGSIVTVSDNTFTAANGAADSTITLQKNISAGDITGDSYITKNMTLDLNGFNMDLGTHYISGNTETTLTVQDSSESKTGTGRKQCDGYQSHTDRIRGCRLRQRHRGIYPDGSKCKGLCRRPQGRKAKKGILLQFEKNYPGTANEANVNDIIKR